MYAFGKFTFCRDAGLARHHMSSTNKFPSARTNSQNDGTSWTFSKSEHARASETAVSSPGKSISLALGCIMWARNPALHGHVHSASVRQYRSYTCQGTTSKPQLQRNLTLALHHHSEGAGLCVKSIDPSLVPGRGKRAPSHCGVSESIAEAANFCATNICLTGIPSPLIVSNLQDAQEVAKVFPCLKHYPTWVAWAITIIFRCCSFDIVDMISC